MTEKDFMFATRPSPSSTTTQPLAEKQEQAPAKTPVVLDMGEASREQGFRLHGCR